MIPFQTILVPTDLREGAFHVEHAFALAATQGAKVHLLHAYGVPSLPAGVLLGADIPARLEEHALKKFGYEVERYRRRPEFGGVILAMGDARGVILHHARALPADLIVMGSHRDSTAAHAVLGHVAEGVVHAAPCAVLIIPPPVPRSAGVRGPSRQAEM